MIVHVLHLHAATRNTNHILISLHVSLQGFFSPTNIAMPIAKHLPYFWAIVLIRIILGILMLERAFGSDCLTIICDVAMVMHAFLWHR